MIQEIVIEVSFSLLKPQVDVYSLIYCKDYVGTAFLAISVFIEGRLQGSVEAHHSPLRSLSSRVDLLFQFIYD